MQTPLARNSLWRGSSRASRPIRKGRASGAWRATPPPPPNAARLWNVRRATAKLAAATIGLVLLASACLGAASEPYSPTHKPVLHGRHWVAITGKPLGATAGARIFEQGGNAIDAACAMLAVVCTMYDELSWGGETQALIYDPRAKKVVGINALGVAPTGATPEFFLNLPQIKTNTAKYPPAEGPL